MAETLRLDVRGDMRAVQQHLRYVDKDVIPKAAAYALNRTGRTATRLAISRIAGALRLPAKLLRERLRARKARWVSLTYTITFKRATAGIPWIKLNAREQKTKRGVGRGVGASGGRRDPHAFIARGTGGRTHVFYRKGPNARPIDVRKQPLQPIADETFDWAINVEGRGLFGKLFAREAQRRTDMKRG